MTTTTTSEVIVTNRLTGELKAWPAATSQDIIESMDIVYAELDAVRLAKTKLLERAFELLREKSKETERQAVADV